jgi:hypothetical protein
MIKTMQVAMAVSLFSWVCCMMIDGRMTIPYFDLIVRIKKSVMRAEE